MDATRKRRLMGEINVVPYIDVMLVLLIIFMVTAPLLSQGIEVELPDAAAEPLSSEMQDSEPLILSVDAAGAYYLNVSDDVCLQQIAKRRIEQPERAKFDTPEVFAEVTQYFEEPSEAEGLEIEIDS